MRHWLAIARPLGPGRTVPLGLGESLLSRGSGTLFTVTRLDHVRAARAAALPLLKSGAEARERRRRPRPTHVSPRSLSHAASPRLPRPEKHFFPPAPRSPRAAARAL